MKYIWIGASGLASKLYNRWVTLLGDDAPVVILDNDIKKKGKDIFNVKVDMLENIDLYVSEDVSIIITTSYIDDIQKQLKSFKLKNRVYTFNEYDQKFNSLVLEKNKILKSSRGSNECFILGNGPSLNNINLNSIKNKDTIVVNHAYKDKRLIDIKPKFWVIADPLFWTSDNGGYDKIEKTIEKNGEYTKLIVSRNALNHLPKEKAFRNYTYFYDSSKSISSDGDIDDIDLTSSCYNLAQNVLSPSILLALYLNYKRIFLLGADHTWWSYTAEDIVAGKPIPHAYKNDENDNRIAIDCYKNLGYEGLRATISRQKLEYQALNNYAKKVNVEIFNASFPSELDTFDKINFNEL